ncbi:unnamed protein product [Tilletia controversa]|nr:hypothetical protein CF336_g4296 [Tilletia laevis]KAE8260964.1 hypothetical protein A4X03_0g3661 [Tilletia caries]CAD6901401.1 unnamed protein product [Tilletia controversa]CAD6938195.1 unnamed protein product [Tilletia controversa]
MKRFPNTPVLTRRSTSILRNASRPVFFEGWKGRTKKQDKRRSLAAASPGQVQAEDPSDNDDRQLQAQEPRSTRKGKRRNGNRLGGTTTAAVAAFASATVAVTSESLRPFFGRLRKSVAVSFSPRRRRLKAKRKNAGLEEDEMPATMMPESVIEAYTGIDRLSLLPVEILFNIMDCLSAPTLVYSFGPASSHLAHVVDLYIRQTISKRINRVILPSFLPDDASSPSGGETRAFTLCFEARRPIDTTATTHELRFERFEVCQDAYKPSSDVAMTYAKVWNPSEQVKRAAHRLMTTTAVFTFAPTAGDRSGGAGRPQKQSGTAGQVEAEAGAGPTTARAPEWQAWRQPFIPTVPTSDTHRVGTEEQTSSITIGEQQPEHEQVDEEEREVEGEELRRAVDAYDWAPTSTIGSHRQPLSKSRRREGSAGGLLPTYRCHLDPLDSFETFLLSLSLKTVCRSRDPTGIDSLSLSSSSRDGDEVGIAQGVPRSRTFERRVASGCDRVMRNWFAPPPSPSTAAAGGEGSQPTMQTQSEPLTSSTLPSASDSAGMGGSKPSEDEERVRKEADRRMAAFQVLASTFGAVEACLPRSVVAKVKAEAAPPPTRTLELDGSGCSIEIQPHANVDSILCSHPILRASSGLSSSPTYTPATTSGTISPSSHSGRAAPSSSGAAESVTSSAWLFSSPFAYHPSSSGTATSTNSSSQNGMDLGSRVELSFHITKIRICAARLLAMLHRLEDDVLHGEEQEKRFLLRTAMPPSAT